MNSKKINKIISQNLKNYKTINNINSLELSQKTGISLQIIKNIEGNTMNREITILELYKISIVLNIPVNKLLENKYD